MLAGNLPHTQVNVILYHQVEMEKKNISATISKRTSAKYNEELNHNK